MEIAGVTVYEFTPSLICENGGAARFKVPKHPRSQIKGALLLNGGVRALYRATPAQWDVLICCGWISPLNLCIVRLW